METNKSEPLIKCRKRRDVIKTGRESLARDKSGGKPVYCPDGGRHGGGVNVAQALVRNVGTCPLMPKGKTPSGRPARTKVPKQSIGAEQPVLVKKLS